MKIISFHLFAFYIHLFAFYIHLFTFYESSLLLGDELAAEMEMLEQRQLASHSLLAAYEELKTQNELLVAANNYYANLQGKDER